MRAKTKTGSGHAIRAVPGAVLVAAALYAALAAPAGRPVVLADVAPAYELEDVLLTGPGEALLFQDGEALEFRLPRAAGGSGDGAASDGAITSPMPGRIVSVSAAAGDKVAKGAPLVTLEAMKMEHAMAAPFDGVVAELKVKAGDQVAEGVLLVRLDKG